MAELSDMRFAHTEGVCDLVFAPDGRVVTCGADGEVRVYRGIEDEDPSSHLVGDEALAVACSEGTFFVSAADNNTVQAYELANGKSKGVAARFTADVTALDLRGETLAAGSADMTLKTVDTATSKCTSYEGHEAPILGVALDPEFLVSSSCDGSVAVWKVGEETDAKVKTLPGLLSKSSDSTTAPSPAKVSWQPQGKAFAVPVSKGVKIFSRGTWDLEAELNCDDLGSEELVGVTAWSPDGTFLAAGTTKGQILVWNAKTKKIAFSKVTSRGYGICAIAWDCKKTGELAFIDNQGYWGVLEKFGPAQGKPGIEKSTSVHIVDDKDEFNEEELASMLFDNDDEDDDNENSFNIRKIKKDTTGFLDDGNSDVFGMDEDSNISKPDKKESDSRSGAPTPLPSVTAAVAAAVAAVQPAEVDVQEPFQPGSTPAHLSSRFMVWNSVGMVRGYSGEDDNSVEVTFHDASVHHPLHIANHHGHTMADLSREAVVLACEASEDEMAPSRIVVNHFSGGGGEWSLELPGKEEVMAVCAGKGWVAAATDRRQLRLMTVSGMQREVVSLPGPVVALAGWGDRIMVAVHAAGTPLPGNQAIAVAVLNVLGDKRRHPCPNYQPLPLAPRSYLSWLGFSDEGVAAAVDSAGFVRLLSSRVGSGAMWTQVCDTRAAVKGKSDHHFVVGISVEERNVRSVVCKGSRFPATVPLPTVVVTQMSLPLCQPLSEKSALEETLLKSEMCAYLVSGSEGDDLRQEQNETLVKLFALAVKAENEARALEACKMMDGDTIQVAYKYASKMRRLQLANRISQLAMDMQDKEEEEREEEEDPEARAEVESSADLFDTQSDFGAEEQEEANPILAARNKKQETAPAFARSKSILKDSQAEPRNPFKKSSNQQQQSGGIKQGLCFDSIAPPAASKPRISSGSQFGARNLNSKSKLTLKKKPEAAAAAAKENSTPLKGFQLWLAENKECLASGGGPSGTEDVNAMGLKRWKDLSKEEKEKYKSPRVPKRKREDEEGSTQKSLRLSDYAA